jgi:hypothetical protein
MHKKTEEKIGRLYNMAFTHIVSKLAQPGAKGAISVEPKPLA